MKYFTQDLEKLGDRAEPSDKVPAGAREKAELKGIKRPVLFSNPGNVEPGRMVVIGCMQSKASF